MNLILTSDWHLGLQQYGDPRRENDVYNAAKFIIDFAINSKYPILLAGDILDSCNPVEKAVSELKDLHLKLVEANIPAFYITHPLLVDELINAKHNGVDVKIIVDETSVKGEYVDINKFQENNIQVKVENWAGKMHMKSIIIDDNTLIIGSMNFTKQGENRNDENVVIIKDSMILTKKYKEHFLKLWNSIN